MKLNHPILEVSLNPTTPFAHIFVFVDTLHIHIYWLNTESV